MFECTWNPHLPYVWPHITLIPDCPTTCNSEIDPDLSSIRQPNHCKYKADVTKKAKPFVRLGDITMVD